MLKINFNMGKYKQQQDLIKAWTKIILNSSYGFPPFSVIQMKYDENKALKITEEGKKRLILIQKHNEILN
jgi:hypothetical protein